MIVLLYLKSEKDFFWRLELAQKFYIKGGTPLRGEVHIGGAKNSVLKLIAASLLVKGCTKIYNVPELTDVNIMLKVVQQLGAKIDYDKKEKSVVIDATNLTGITAPYELVSKMRASFVVLGALVSRCREAKVAMPGGCAIGERRVDFHIKGLEALGAKIKIENGYVIAKANKLTGAEVYLDIPSVGATENIMLASILAEGSTRIQNAAQEPEIVDLANFLNTMGADVNGAGTSEIVINGVKQDHLHSIEYTTIPDRIEAGTYMTAIIATKGKGIIRDIYPAHLTFYTNKLLKMGANIKLLDPTSMEVSCKNRLNSINFITQPYPGFPTDLQSMAMVLLTTANGVGIITESLYENRFMQVPDLNRMGADIHQDRNHAIIKGVKKLSGTTLTASDLRAGAALVVAALMADGNSVVEKIHHIDRGYENFENKLRLLGGKIERREDNSQMNLTEVKHNESYL
ncbi:MAG TPA: UDP-N-acetylglucosamine 1-carboxyvinyltransferase [Cyanobacteria bacterium UBA11991]|nr:UDP-N-acetylglucosamine 1-carboxyvinyltransferase [Cyanobacteriota bacterium]MDY6358801.1 UDP-N-acetylglucosamine 1-carboxyvinyltransferase [Cyanobacteriota bacterium]MDY6364644.1 UDP-N-acetylglucosamine 1-carboxyvinyltransferase [Cyanobacteriota bacterium]MDY6383182.1 UDP-N-acetylglucosamine 1-carboxyvinyltransferase [Cyanobacteriota bacterium]HCB10673.1 UDP-N-acetylglucosamine 1-carboxyvinyltransferase [Cyanobacteria bacterium UBA11991]